MSIVNASYFQQAAKTTGAKLTFFPDWSQEYV